MYWFKHGRDVCIGSNMREMYVLVQTWERCMYWHKHEKMYVLVQTWERCSIGLNMRKMCVLVQT